MTKNDNSPHKSGFFLGLNDPAWTTAINQLREDGISFSYIAGTQAGLDDLESPKGIVTQEIINLYRGIITDAPNLQEHRVDEETLNSYCLVEQVCMDLCDRMDQSYSFSRAERERLYIGALEYWLYIVGEYTPQFVVFTATPHSVYEYVLYAIAKRFNIPVLMFLPIVALQRVLPYQNYMDIGVEVQKTYREYCDDNLQNFELANDLLDYVDRYKQSYNEVIPDYLKKRLEQHNEAQSKTRLINNGQKLLKLDRYPHYFLSIISLCTRRLRELFRNQQTSRILNRNYLKMPGEAFELTEGLDSIQWRQYKQWAGQYKEQLKKSYDAFSQTLDERINFIYVPLHYQPERTTTPEGGRYSNQLLMIRLISSVLPQGWEIVVKENPSQLLPDTLHGERGRYAYYYDDLAAIPNVRMVPMKTDQFTLIDKCVAVATLTGTTGWEAIMRSKPVLCFGHAWYRGCEGTLRVSSKADCNAAMEMIQKGIVVDRAKVLCFLAALDHHSFKGFLNLKRYQDYGFGKQNNIDNLVPIIKNFVES
ncbi:MAG: hypothetical protein ACI8P9_000732 [Parasphingorhabdus sp.]|jgi:hypothetical protein